MTRASVGIERVPVQCKDIDKISVPCQDDPFGLNCEVVFEDMSVPLRRCTPFMNRSADYRIVVPGENPENAVGQVLDSFAVNRHVCVPIHLTVRDDEQPYKTEYPVQCQDDPYPSNGVVVSGEMSYPLHSCTSQMTGYWRYLSRAGVINAENRHAGPRYGHGGNRPQPLERDGPHEEEKNFPLKGEKKKPRKKTKERIPQYIIICSMDRLASFGNDLFDNPPCRGCSSYLVEPYIKCAECGPSPFLLCLQCFTRGYEYKKHQSDHTYEIMTSDFPILEPGWTAQEEMALLEAVMDCGFGNWQDVAYQMRTKTKEECEGHYMKNFINNPLFSSTLLSLRQMEEHLSRTADTAIPFKPTDDPPRPSFDSQLSRDMAGYMPARADFMEEFDNYAEWDLKDIDFVDDDSDILHALKVAVVDIYHSRLKERQRRKKIIRDHGLINLRKFQMLERRYPKEVQDLYDVMRRFARVVGPIEHDKFIESHALEFELRREIHRLQEYRREGIQSFCGAKVYERVKCTREDERRKRNMLCDILQYIHDSRACQQWLHKQAAIDAGITPVVTTITTSVWFLSTGRRSAPPLNLTGLPGTEKLNEREKELCQVVRLVPGAYLEYKQALLNECRRQGGLRLAQARSLIKIDVNKTRKIYDFLIKEGYINKA
ncbi:putative transcriptional adapter 2-alpha [Triplophysa rosa]|uniref:Transcriptional adapter 2-alpha n=2 Tax=Cypriniformes TaxID=7952 RepID=A0A9W7TRI2_TRIRA|nr:putative transcriptional adapter 2-alpha [Triplophysa rosa]